MELTGSLYQDYTTLKNTYDRYGALGAHILTRDEDTIFQIMLDMDITELSSFCQTNQVANALCHDKNFWMMKFDQDDLPIIKPFDVNTNYVKEYQLTKLAQNNAKMTIAINNIERTRKVNPSDGAIGIYINNDVDLSISSHLLSKFIDINDITNKPYLISIVYYKNIIKLYVDRYDTNQHPIKLYNNYTTNADVIDLLIIVFYYHQLNHNILLRDSNSNNFIVHLPYIDIMKRTKPQRYELYHGTLFKRMGMKEVLEQSL